MKRVTSCFMIETGTRSEQSLTLIKLSSFKNEEKPDQLVLEDISTT